MALQNRASVHSVRSWTGAFSFVAGALRPELVQPQIEPVEAAVVDRVDPPRALGGNGDEVRIQKRFQVLRNCRAADRKRFGEFIDRLRRAPQLLQQEPPVRI